MYRRGCLLYHLSTEKLLIFEGGRQYVIYSKRNEPRLSVVEAFMFININFNFSYMIIFFTLAIIKPKK
nr:MAG TPA: Putative Holin-like Toxin (Hol-Tox) [Caudoviricetes sp.]